MYSSKMRAHQVELYLSYTKVEPIARTQDKIKIYKTHKVLKKFDLHNVPHANAANFLNSRLNNYSRQEVNKFGLVHSTQIERKDRKR